MGFLDRLFGGSKPAPRASVSVPSASNRCVRNTQPFYVERGWQLRGNTLHGWYRTRRGAVEGRIERAFGDGARYFIINPPQKLLTGEHSSCFHQRGENRFEVHFSKKPADLTGGIMELERLLFEALG